MTHSQSSGAGGSLVSRLARLTLKEVRGQLGTDNDELNDICKHFPVLAFSLLTEGPLGPGKPMFPGWPLGPVGPGGPPRPSCPAGPWRRKWEVQQDVMLMAFIRADMDVKQ